MPNIRIRDKWDKTIRQISEDNPKWSARRVHQEIKELSDKGELPPDPPSLPTVGRSLAEDYDKGPYQRFHWPEAMETGALPWEASAACLELMAICDKDAAGHIRNARPTMSTCRWYWRLSLAAPSLDPIARYAIALAIANGRALGQPLPEGLDMWLAYRPYKPWPHGRAKAAKREFESRKADYEKAVSRQQNPIEHYADPPRVPIGPGRLTHEGRAALNAMFAGMKRAGLNVQITEKEEEKGHDNNQR